jgi:hypothetical protein
MNNKQVQRITLVIALIGILAATGFARASVNPDKRPDRLVGTWLCDVGGPEPFRALQTFHADGTFQETSSLLAQGEEGPAHGVWKRDNRQYQLTFQLFAFDPSTGESPGMIRVRIRLRVDSPDHLTANFGVVDFIDPDGNITELDRGPDPYTCDRLKVVPVP